MWATLTVTVPAIAETPGVVPSQEEIGRQLKLRGLPSVGSFPAPAAGPGSAAVPASVSPASSSPRETGRRSAGPAASGPAVAPATAPSITFTTITFEFGSSRLRPESIETLRNLGNALKQELRDERAFIIEGHTDRTGTRAYNDALSKRRADAVKEYLVNEMAVSADRLLTVGKGFLEPIDPKRPYAATNRRVVMINAGA
jgi:outer membrane protein OmpA-like peptidoglycan-associated protein